MANDTLTQQLNAGYSCPPDAGNAWRAAVASGIDMSLVERSLQMTPWERLLQHDEALEFTLALREAGLKVHAEP